MYCGDLSFNNFKDASEEGIAGLLPSELDSKNSQVGFMSLSWQDTSYNHGLSQYCIIAAYGQNINNQVTVSVFGNKNGKLKTSGTQTVGLNFDLSKIPDDISTTYLLLTLQDEGALCPASYTNENKPEGKARYYFKVNKSEISNGQQKKIVIGSTGTSFTKKIY